MRRLIKPGQVLPRQSVPHIYNCTDQPWQKVKLLAKCYMTEEEAEREAQQAFRGEMPHHGGNTPGPNARSRLLEVASCTEPP